MFQRIKPWKRGLLDRLTELSGFQSNNSDYMKEYVASEGTWCVGTYTWATEGQIQYSLKANENT